MSKYLILNFKNAGLFRKHRRKDGSYYSNSKNNVYDYNGSRKRKDLNEFDEPITVHQISNLLHVLFGERPVPTLRASAYKKIDYIYEKALKSYLRIDTIKINEYGDFPSEFIQLNKEKSNSSCTVIYNNWNRFHKSFDNHEFKMKFINYANEVLGYDILSKPYDVFRENIINSKDSRVEELMQMLFCNQKKRLYYNILKINETGLNDSKGRPNLYNGYKTNIVSNINGVGKISNLKGQIIVPVNDDDIERLRKHSGSATLLDGGFVYIKGIKSGNSLNVDDFTKVSEISLKMR